MPELIPLKTWLMHVHSENVFRILKYRALHFEVEDLGGVKGFANRYLTEQYVRTGEIIVDAKGPMP